MFTGQFKRTDLSEFTSNLLGRGNVALGDDTEAAFALLCTEGLGLPVFPLEIASTLGSE
jgi:hypothetical protein